MKTAFTILLLCLFTLISVHAQEDNKKHSRIAPEFTLQSTEGETVSLKSYYVKGPVLLCFIGVGCVTCVEEIKEYQKIYQEYTDSSFSMIAVPLINEKNISKVKPFIKSRGYAFPVLLDADGETARKYYIHEVPHTILINQEGKIVYSHSGYTKGDELVLRNKIKALLKKV